MLKNYVLALISAYQKTLRLFLPAQCRFTPSCSEYAKQAILKYGFWKGMYKSAGRIFSCHPFSRRSANDPLI